jgi:hypothetical protein
MRLAVAEGQQRALMLQHQSDGAAAAQRLSRILQLEGQLMDMQVRSKCVRWCEWCTERAARSRRWTYVFARCCMLCPAPFAAHAVHQGCRCRACRPLLVSARGT